MVVWHLTSAFMNHCIGSRKRLRSTGQHHLTKDVWGWCPSKTIDGPPHLSQDPLKFWKSEATKPLKENGVYSSATCCSSQFLRPRTGVIERADVVLVGVTSSKNKHLTCSGYRDMAIKRFKRKIFKLSSRHHAEKPGRSCQPQEIRGREKNALTPWCLGERSGPACEEARKLSDSATETYVIYKAFDDVFSAARMEVRASDLVG